MKWQGNFLLLSNQVKERVVEEKVISVILDFGRFGKVTNKLIGELKGK